MTQVRGYIPQKPSPRQPNGFAESLLSTVQLFQDLKIAKAEIERTLDDKISEAEIIIEESQNSVAEGTRKIDDKIAEFERTAIGLIKEIQNIPTIKGAQGEPGKTIDEVRLKQEILAKIPSQEDIIKETLRRIPKIDTKALTRSIIEAIPDNKDSLKIIQKRFETDPMSVIDKILSLPPDKFKLKSDNIDGLEQTISAFRNQIARKGYLHGGGFSNIYEAGALVTNGLTGLNFTGSGIDSVSKTNGIVTVDISGGGSSTSVYVQSFTTSGGTENITLTNIPISLLIVTLNGQVLLSANGDYSLSGSTLSLLNPGNPAGLDGQIVYLYSGNSTTAESILTTGGVQIITLAHTPTTVLVLSINGQVLNLDIDYTLSGTTLTLLNPMTPSGLNGSIVYNFTGPTVTYGSDILETTGGIQTIALSHIPVAVIITSINGEVLDPGIDYTLSGANLTLLNPATPAGLFGSIIYTY